MDTVVNWPLDRQHLTLLTEPDALHRAVMTHLPDMAGRSRSIRKDTGTQFRVDLPTDPLGREGVIRLRLRGAAVEVRTAVQVEAHVPVDGCTIVLQVAAERRNTQDGRIRVRPVVDHEASEWARALLRRHGFVSEEVAVSGPRRLGARGNLGFWVRDVRAVVSIADSELAMRAHSAGIGRGRAYGLGMVVTVPTKQVHAQEEPGATDQGGQE